jgi:hypothetical protein
MRLLIKNIGTVWESLVKKNEERGLLAVLFRIEKVSHGII